ncbi:MAG TPA: hypothetical protein VKW78_01105 [Terriglobales bacterium]|nr:hypothetical protein [Terriglobales bacterium]
MGGIVLGFCAVVSPKGLPEDQEVTWPKIVAIERTFEFEDAQQAHANVMIEGVDGKPLYRLLCLGPSLFKTDSSFDYSGDFDCRLQSLYSHEFYSTLLTDNPRQERSWESRGRFLWSEIRGVCSGYPEYGQLRTFRLRGMVITLKIEKPVWVMVESPSGPDSAKEGVASFRFSLQVKEDPSAYSSIAEEVPYENPELLKTGCSRVVARHVRGIVEESYIRANKLSPPFPEVVSTSKAATLPGENEDFSFADKPIPPRNRAFSMSIRNAKGKVLYTFECSSTEPIMRWGVSCGLFAAGQTLNLLQDSTDPYSGMDRATIFPEQLDAICSKYPDWGGKREFKLRGFRLIVRAANVKFVPSEWDWYGKGISHMTLKAEVTPDKTATSAVADFPRYAYWGYTYRSNPDDACLKPISNPWHKWKQ